MPPRLLGTLVIKSLREIAYDLGGDEYKLEDRVPRDGWLGTATSATVHVEVECKPLPSIFTFQRWEVIRMLEAVWEFSVIFGLFPSMVQEIIAVRGAHGYCSYTVQAGPGVARGSAGRLGDLSKQTNGRAQQNAGNIALLVLHNFDDTDKTKLPKVIGRRRIRI
ncbi:MAG: hypothetical protein Q9164_003023 [Protoblastenia rupestris]